MPKKGLEAEKVYWENITDSSQSGTSLIRLGGEVVFTGQEFDPEDQRHYTAIAHFDPRTFFGGISGLSRDGTVYIPGRKPYQECGMGLVLSAGKDMVDYSVFARVHSTHYKAFRGIVPRETFHEEEAVVAVIAANARISPEQFQALARAIGQPVQMQYDYHAIYSDEEPSTHDKIIEEFILRGVNYIKDPAGQVYLAFARSAECTYFPYWRSDNPFQDITEFQIKSLSLPSGEMLWRFEHPGDLVSNGNSPRSIYEDIKDHSEKMPARAVK